MPERTLSSAVSREVAKKGRTVGFAKAGTGKFPLRVAR
jgi:hypothetical protein